MSFTDNDLRRLKRELKNVSREVESPGRVVSFEDLEALIARLEAAEDAIQYLGTVLHDTKGLDAVDKWRKAAGK